MTQILDKKAIGLFGTCGGSTWREPFIELFTRHGISFFNPQVANWTPELADIEAWHLANDRLILFPVTDETFAFGSLSETGFSIQSSLSINANRFVLLYIAPDVNDACKAESPEQADASRRARKLVLAHYAKVSNPNVFIATSMQDMQDKVLKLYAALDLLDSVRESQTDWRSSLSAATWLQMVHGIHEEAGQPKELTGAAT